MDENEETLLALLIWHLDASDGQYAQINSHRDDARRLVRSFEFEVGETRMAELNARARSALIAYRAGQIDGPRKATAA